MIRFIRGIVVDAEADSLIIDVNNIGMQVLAPVNRMTGQYSVGEEIFLWTHFIVREDQWSLFGFLTRDELNVFRMIINISGIGGKSAVAILNTLSVENIVNAVHQSDSHPFEQVSGIGKKTAQRIVLELKDKVDSLGITVSGKETTPIENKSTEENQDAVAALVTLGYSRGEAQKAVKAVLSEDPLISDDALLRKALIQVGKF